MIKINITKLQLYNFDPKMWDVTHKNVYFHNFRLFILKWNLICSDYVFIIGRSMVVTGQRVVGGDVQMTIRNLVFGIEIITTYSLILILTQLCLLLLISLCQPCGINSGHVNLISTCRIESTRHQTWCITKFARLQRTEQIG